MTAAPERANSEVKNAMLPRSLAAWVADFRSSDSEQVNFQNGDPKSRNILTVIQYECDRPPTLFIQGDL